MIPGQALAAWRNDATKVVRNLGGAPEKALGGEVMVFVVRLTVLGQFRRNCNQVDRLPAGVPGGLECVLRQDLVSGLPDRPIAGAVTVDDRFDLNQCRRPAAGDGKQQDDRHGSPRDRGSPSPRPLARHLETYGRPNGRVWRPSPNETNSQRKQSGSEGGQGQVCSMPESRGTMPSMAFVTGGLSLGGSSCASVL